MNILEVDYILTSEATEKQCYPIYAYATVYTVQ